MELEVYVVTAITSKVAFVMALFTELINVREALWTLSSLTRNQVPDEATLVAGDLNIQITFELIFLETDQ
jgi:hypothetical protein